MKEIKRNSLQAWILAARPKTLTGAVTPVLIGTALAAMDGHFEWLPALICCVFASLMQIAANFINDLFDFLKGTDREDRLGPRPKGFPEGKQLMQSGGGLTIFHGTKDTLICGCYGQNPWLLSGRVPNAPKVCRRVPKAMNGGHEMDWRPRT